jgi:hypothetical protein
MQAVADSHQRQPPGNATRWLAECQGDISEKTIDFPSNRIFRHIHGVLNIDKNKTNYTV